MIFEKYRIQHLILAVFASATLVACGGQPSDDSGDDLASVPPFDILGVQGGTDSTVDGYLTGGINPNISWEANSYANSFSVRISTESNSDVCAAQSTGNTNFSFDSCNLSEGQTYLAHVFASTAAGNVQASNSPFTFLVDTVVPASSIDINPAAIDNNPTPTFEFSGSDATSGVASYQCRVDGSAWATCTSPTVIPAPLADGSHTLDVRAIDVAGLIEDTPSTYTWTVDATAPETSIDASPGSPDGDSTPDFQFSGTDAESGVASYECRMDGGAWGACASPYTVAPALADGSHTFEVRTIDNAGNADASPASHTWTVDTMPPAGFTITGVQGGADSTADAYLTSGINPHIYWGASTGATNYDVVVRNAADSADVCASQNTSNTDYNFAACNLVEGTSYKVLVTANDDVPQSTAAGNNPFDFTVDTVAPDTSITVSPADPDSNTTPTFEFNGTDATSGVASFECRIDGAAWGACVSPYVTPTLAAGGHTFEVRAIDNAGLIDATPASHTWTIDNSAPDPFNITGIQGGADTTSDAFLKSGTQPHIYWAASTGATNYDVVVRNAADSADVCALQNTTGTDYDFAGCTLVEGTTYNIRVTAKDDVPLSTEAGNNPFSFIVDTIAPETAIDVAPNDPDNDTTPTFEFSGTDAGSGIASYECQLDGGGWGACTSPYTIGAALGQGSHTFEVRAYDNAGFVDGTPASHTWTVDSLAPGNFSITGVQGGTDSTSDGFLTNGSLVHVYWGAAAGATNYDVTIRNNGDSADVCATQNTAGTDYNFAGCPLTEGVSYKVNVAAKDDVPLSTDADNMGFDFTVDTVAPTTTIDVQPSNPDNTGTPSFEFSGADATSGVASYECQIDGGGWTACTSPTTFSPALSAGSHTFEVRAIDNAGHVDLTPASYTWSIDLTLPSISIDSQPTDPSNDQTPTFTFSGADGESGIDHYECQVDSGGWNTCTSPHTTGALSYASHTFEVRSHDVAGNISNPVASYTWTVSAQAPTPTSLTLNDPASSPWDDTTPEITVGGVQNGNTVRIYADNSCSGGVVVSGVATGTSINLTIPALGADGSYNYWATQDNGSLESNCSSATVEYELYTGTPGTPSGLSLFNPISSPEADSTPEILVSGVTSGHTIRLYTDNTCTTEVGSGTAAGSSIAIASSDLGADGTYNFYARADYGNKSSSCSTATVAYTLDSALTPASMPTGLSLFDPNTSPSSDVTPIIQVTGVANGDTVYLYTDAACTALVGTVTATGAVANVQSSSLAEGSYTFYAQRDNATSSPSACSTANVAYEIIIVPPTAPTSLSLNNPSVSPSNDSTPLITVGGVESGATVRVFSDNTCSTEVGSITSVGTSTDVLINALAEATYTFYANQTTVSGLTSACSTANVTYQYDTGVSLPDPPSGLSLVTPAVSPDNDTTPTLQVAGVANGDTVRLFSDSGCTTQLATGTSSGTTVELTTSALGNGQHVIYANRTDTAGPTTSNCSSVFVVYEVTSDIQFDNFEAGYGNWTNVVTDDHDWSLNSGGTNSNGIGPTSGYGGSGQYVYTEASSPVAVNEVFVLESNTLNAGANNLAVAFKWNKRGTNMGDLYLEVSTDGGTNWDEAIWSHQGMDVATNGADVWNGAAVDLCGLGYNSGNIKLRFRAVMPSVEDVYNSDIAIDDVRVYSSSCSPSPSVSLSTEHPYVTILNQASYPVGGTCSNNGGTILVRGAASVDTVCSEGTWSANLDLSGSPDGDVDLLVQHFYGSAQGLAFETFTKDSSILTFDNFEFGLGNFIQGTGDDYDWSRNSGGTPSNGIGPTSGFGGSGYYMYTEASSPTGTNDEFHFEHTINLDAGTYNVDLDFKYNKRGNNMGDLYVDVSTDGGSNWTNEWSHIGADVGSNGTDIWRDANLDICGEGYNSGNVMIRFRAVMPNSGQVFNSDIAIDNVVVSNGDCTP